MKDTHITQPQFAMIWFGAALSIAEIMTGTYLAPLGLTPRSICHHTGAYYRRHTALWGWPHRWTFAARQYEYYCLQLWPTRG